MTVEGETFAEARQRVTGRQCGDCSLCCFLLSVPEAGKPDDGWCPHCRPGKGCSIWADRPTVCKGYACQWLMDSTMPDWWKPNRAKMIVDVHEAAKEIRVIAHPNYANRWREEPYYEWLKLLAKRGFQMGFKTVISVGNRKAFVLLPHDEVQPYVRNPD